MLFDIFVWCIILYCFFFLNLSNRDEMPPKSFDDVDETPDLLK